MEAQYVSTADGVRIAYVTHGHGPPLVFVRGWFSHIGLMWEDPPFRVYFEALERQFTIVRFDMRGSGLSARDATSIDLDGMVADLEAVVDGIPLERFILYGQCFGGPAAMAYTARHPERVSKLILDGTYAEGRRVGRPERQRQIIATLRDLPEAGLAFLTHLTHPNPGPSAFRVHTPHAPAVDIETAVALYTLGFAFDVRDVLPQISAPTLVMHRESTRAIPFRLGRELASSIRGARFVPLEGQAHNSWEEFPDAAIAALADFLGVPLQLAALEEAPERFLAILVADPGGTATADGDAIKEIVRRAVQDHRGGEVTHKGSGIMAYFPAARDAVECAIVLQRELSARDTPLRIGVHAGEPVGQGGEPPDTVARVATRAVAACDAGQILVSAAIREHCAGYGFLFDERDVITGDAGADILLFQVRWREEA
jgi:pimeloyl-ACP methyl ester carboxylesterase